MSVLQCIHINVTDIILMVVDNKALTLLPLTKYYKTSSAVAFLFPRRPFDRVLTICQGCILST